jgi:DNA-damage-inducible protein D
LAANLFRITQTEAKITRDNIRGQSRLEDAAFDVGREVRHTMERVSGTVPEELPVAEDIRRVRGKLKGTRKQLEDDRSPNSGE